jgi:N-acetylmuramoyl-L-alanine amidase
MRKIKKFIVHCSATPNDRDVSSSDIKGWHVNDNGWSDIGYHFVIRCNGCLEFGRPVDKIGAHTKGQNTDSIGVCMIGTDEFTQQQFSTLNKLWEMFKITYNGIECFGHRDFTDKKTCPNFDVREHLKP